MKPYQFVTATLPLAATEDVADKISRFVATERGPSVASDAVVDVAAMLEGLPGLRILRGIDLQAPAADTPFELRAALSDHEG